MTSPHPQEAESQRTKPGALTLDAHMLAITAAVPCFTGAETNSENDGVLLRCHCFKESVGGMCRNLKEVKHIAELNTQGNRSNECV